MSRPGCVSAVTFLAVAFIWQRAIAAPAAEAAAAADNVPPEGFTALFNGKDLSGWKGLVKNPRDRARMSPEELAEAQLEADRQMNEHWAAEDGVLVFDGKGQSLCTAKDYADFELLVDWKIHENGDSGVYLRGSPQVQIWDPAHQNGIGSGGLFNNQRHPSRPLVTADRPIGEWNTFRIIMLGERVTIYLNDVLVVDDVPLENYWERDEPIYPSGQIELQNHGNKLYFKNVFIRELPRVPDRVTARPVVERGDLVAIVGDSITEQKLYSRYIEDYLIACVPHLDLRVVQLGWSGERAPGFASRLENDLSPLRADVVTTCYGMNDGLYRPYEPSIGDTYRQAMEDIVYRLKQQGAVVVVGSPGAVDTHTFNRAARVKPDVYNQNLARLRDIARDTALRHGMPFANVHDPMVVAQMKAKPALGDEYHVCGADGFHPAPNGHLVMAYAFLKAMGFDGEIGTITVDMKGSASASEGHSIVATSAGKVEVESSRYPFCFHGDERSPDGTRSILPHVPFNRDLNRLMLRVVNLETERARVAWGAEARSYSKKELEAGINLAADFIDNPFREAFQRIDELVAEKQRYETPMVKEVITRFRTVRDLLGDSVDAEAAMETLRRKLVDKDQRLRDAVRAALEPVRHTLVVAPE